MSTNDILHNASCRVWQENNNVLHCEVPTGGIVTLQLLLAGMSMVMLLAGLWGFVSDIFPLRLAIIISSLMSASGLIFGTLGVRRLKRSGNFILDKTKQHIERKNNRDALCGTWKFSDFDSYQTVIDITDGTRLDLLPEFPHWLIVRFKDGSAIRVAKGSIQQLKNVQRELEAFGLGAAE